MKMTTQIGLLSGGRKLALRPKQVYVSPATGVKSDLEKLLTRFTETNSVRYEEFAELWRDMKMTLIFAGRQTDADCREFLEDSFRITVQFLLPPYNFQVRVGALYILYALYVKQPCTPVVKIRVLSSEFAELGPFLEEVKKQHHLDVEYVYHSLMYHRAFSLTATPLPMFPQMREGTVEDQLVTKQDMLLEQKSILSEIMEPDNIDQLSAIHEQYHRIKCVLSGGRAQPKTSLNVIKSSLVQYITKSVAAHEEKRKHIIGKKSRRRLDSGQTTTSESEGDSDIEANEDRKRSPRDTQASQQVGERRAAIKARAFSTVETASRSRRHRQAVTESSQTEESFSLDSPISSPPTRKRKCVVSREALTEEDCDLSQLNQQLKQRFLSMPNFSEFTDVSTAKTKDKSARKRGSGKEKQKRKVSGKKRQKESVCDSTVKTERSSEEGPSKQSATHMSKSDKPNRNKVKSERTETGRKAGKRIPKIQLREKKVVKEKNRKTKPSKKKTGNETKKC